MRARTANRWTGPLDGGFWGPPVGPAPATLAHSMRPTCPQSQCPLGKLQGSCQFLRAGWAPFPPSWSKRVARARGVQLQLWATHLRAQTPGQPPLLGPGESRRRAGASQKPCCIPCGSQRALEGAEGGRLLEASQARQGYSLEKGTRVTQRRTVCPGRSDQVPGKGSACRMEGSRSHLTPAGMVSFYSSDEMFLRNIK